MRAALARLAGVVMLVAAGSTMAGLFDDEEARQQIADLKKQVGELHSAMDARVVSLETALRAQGLIDLLNQVEALKSDLSKLRGQIEVTSYEIEQAQKRQRDLYVDLDTRLRKLETVPQEPAQAPGAAVDPNTPPPLPPTISPNVAAIPMPKLPPSGNTRTVAEAAVSSEQQAYDAASEQFRAGKYPEALAQFQAFLRSFPQSPLAPSAQYWVGNAYYAQRDFAAAIAAQRALIRGFPDSQKAPDALLNIASAQAEQGDAAAARKTLEDLLARYPQAEAADKAKKRLAGAR